MLKMALIEPLLSAPEHSIAFKEVERIKVKIGIITFHHTTNYGATLQAYGLWSFLQTQGYDVEIIDYRPLKAIKYYTKGLFPITKKLGLNLKAFANISKSWKMRKFLLSNVKLSPRKVYFKKGLQNFLTRYDVAICGSDQIWCLKSYRGFDPAFFLDFVSNQTTRKVSYAASFGKTTALDHDREDVCELVSQFQTVLVRDTNSLKIIKGECNKESAKVLDPTFLIEYDAIKQTSKVTDNYLLIYNQAELSPAETDFVNSVAKSKKLTIVSVGKFNQLANVNLINASPKEWIGLYSSATYVVTNTYHGTIFSIIFQKPFTVFADARKLNKIGDLLISLGLEERIFSESKSLNEQMSDIEYYPVSKGLELKISESKSYLIEAIEQKGSQQKKLAK